MLRCNWCGEGLHGYARAIYLDDDGKKYCCGYCLRMKIQADQADNDETTELKHKPPFSGL
ncbi:MAG: hypothetical protein KJ971_08745 [Firmicutes bacterium]|nr:hypothetical protein [Bacillota bacterium]